MEEYLYVCNWLHQKNLCFCKLAHFKEPENVPEYIELFLHLVNVL